ncbi:hypothetical protein BH10PSE14_BH10PSE14_45570 [soil metagenome]
MDGALKIVRCNCGRVRCDAVGDPIVSAVCYCSDCQAGGRQLEALSGAPSVLDPDDGTPYLTYRQDRFKCVEGAELLIGYKLSDAAPTQRFVASCCNSGMFLKFAPGFWISAYRKRFAEPLPPIEMRNKTGRRYSALPLPVDAPAYRGFPSKLFWRLIMARAAMLIGR